MSYLEYTQVQLNFSNSGTRNTLFGFPGTNIQYVVKPRWKFLLIIVNRVSISPAFNDTYYSGVISYNDLVVNLNASLNGLNCAISTSNLSVYLPTNFLFQITLVINSLIDNSIWENVTLPNPTISLNDAACLSPTISTQFVNSSVFGDASLNLTYVRYTPTEYPHIICIFI